MGIASGSSEEFSNKCLETLCSTLCPESTGLDRKPLLLPLTLQTDKNPLYPNKHSVTFTPLNAVL